MTNLCSCGRKMFWTDKKTSPGCCLYCYKSTLEGRPIIPLDCKGLEVNKKEIVTSDIIKDIYDGRLPKNEIRKLQLDLLPNKFVILIKTNASNTSVFWKNATWKVAHTKRKLHLNTKLFDPSLLETTLDRDNHKCVLCGNSSQLTCHHIIPRKELPYLLNYSNNLVTLCLKCHFTKAHVNYNTKSLNIGLAELFARYTGLL